MGRRYFFARRRWRPNLALGGNIRAREGADLIADAIMAIDHLRRTLSPPRQSGEAALDLALIRAAAAQQGSGAAARSIIDGKEAMFSRSQMARLWNVSDAGAGCS